jgi:hypothetical protein
MNDSAAPNVKAFISYAWSSNAHEDWVLDLATRLASDGVEVVFDKWDLQVGHDAHAFMEKMVTDPLVTKVMMICDRMYKEKADGRMGGVGKETTILTAEIYEKTEQNKYAAIITDTDEQGRRYVPAYYGGRQYIDFTDPSKAEIKYQELLRWLFDKPKHVRPKLGTAPSFITDPDAVVTSTTSKFKATEHAIKTNALQAGGLIADFGEAMVAEFREAKPTPADGEQFDEAVLRAAASMRPAMRHFHELVLAEARYSGTNFNRFLRIMERVGSLTYRPRHVMQWMEREFDAYRMMSYEGFLGLIAILISEQRFDLIGQAVNHTYHIPERETWNGPVTTTFAVFNSDVSSMRERKQRLVSNRVDLYADLIADTYKLSYPTVASLIEADVLLHVKTILSDADDQEKWWWPRMVIYFREFGFLDLFARSESLAFFQRWATEVFGPISVEEFREAVTNLQPHRGYLGNHVPTLGSLTNSKNLGSRP